MSEIDRIAEKYALQYKDNLPPHGHLLPIAEIRAALIEYGEIVREECAKEAEAVTDVPNPPEPPRRMWRHFGNTAIAEAIRRMNDANKG